jgi:hypothetical protein
MWQELLITDVTQMSEDRVCIAGINHQGKSIRPCLFKGIYQRHILPPYVPAAIRPRAVFQMFLNPKKEHLSPHTEDHTWHFERETKFIRIVDDSTWRDALKRISSTSIEEIVGLKLHRNKNIKPGSGIRSLGVIKPESIDWFDYKLLNYADTTKQGYRLSFTDLSGEKYQDISISDLAFRRYVVSQIMQGNTPNKVSYEIKQMLNRAEVWLRVGLTRDFEGWCWLQVNGIFTFPDYLTVLCRFQRNQYWIDQTGRIFTCVPFEIKSIRQQPVPGYAPVHLSHFHISECHRQR